MPDRWACMCRCLAGEPAPPPPVHPGEVHVHLVKRAADDIDETLGKPGRPKGRKNNHKPKELRNASTIVTV